MLNDEWRFTECKLAPFINDRNAYIFLKTQKNSNLLKYFYFKIDFLALKKVFTKLVRIYFFEERKIGKDMEIEIWGILWQKRIWTFNRFLQCTNCDLGNLLHDILIFRIPLRELRKCLVVEWKMNLMKIQGVARRAF